MKKMNTRSIRLIACAGLAASSSAFAGEYSLSRTVPIGLALQDVAQVTTVGPITTTSLYLRVGEIDASVPRNDLAAVAGLQAVTSRHHVIQLDGPMTPQRRHLLEGAGIQIGEYLPVNAFVTNMQNADPARVANLGFVRWHTPYQSSWKLAPEIGQFAFATVERQQLMMQGQLALAVTLFQNEDAQAAARQIQGIKSAVVFWSETIGSNPVLSVQISNADINKLAAIDAVMFVDEAPEMTLRAMRRNNTNRWIVQSNVTNVTPLYDNGIHGEGQIVGVIDGKVDQNHCSFTGQIAGYAGTPGADFHGTHVAATAMGNAGVDNNTRGVAWGADLAYAPIPGFNEASMVSRLNIQHNVGASVHTNSWGNDGTTAYDSLARGIDVFSNSNEFDLVMFAVTNTTTLKNPENAKNLLAVGASQDTPGQANFCSGGRGPTSDGRRKPEIFAPGCNTQSALSSSGCSTTGLTGTSMASPAIAGTAALITQYYEDGFYPTGVATPGNAFVPTGALVKATILNSAVDMTGITGYPSDREGWGRVLADNALFFPADTRSTMVQDVLNAAGLTTGQNSQFTFDVGSSTEDLNVTIVWNDPAATAGTSFAAVNDLDLEVIAPNGTIYKGNVFSSGISVTGGTKDDRNNVEQVRLPTPPLGTWTARIVGAAVNQSTQGFALVVSGGLGAPTNAMTFEWTVQGGGSTTVAPGQSTTLVLSANRATGEWYGGGKFNVNITGLDPTDSLDTGGGVVGPEIAGNFTVGRDQAYRAIPGDGAIIYSLVGNEIFGNFDGNSIDHAVLPPLLGGSPPTVNPTPFWTVNFTAGTTLGIRTFNTNIISATVGQGGLPVPAGFLNGSIDITVAGCLVDLNGDGNVDVLDFFTFITLFNNSDPQADLNGDGNVDVLDFFEFINLFNLGC